MAELERGKAEFCPLPVRSFAPSRILLMPPSKQPCSKQLKKNIQEVRLIYKLRSDQIDLIDSATIHQALSSAHNWQ